MGNGIDKVRIEKFTKKVLMDFEESQYFYDMMGFMILIDKGGMWSQNEGDS